VEQLAGELCEQGTEDAEQLLRAARRLVAATAVALVIRLRTEADPSVRDPLVEWASRACGADSESGESLSSRPALPWEDIPRLVHTIFKAVAQDGAFRAREVAEGQEAVLSLLGMRGQPGGVVRVPVAVLNDPEGRVHSLRLERCPLGFGQVMPAAPFSTAPGSSAQNAVFDRVLSSLVPAGEDIRWGWENLADVRGPIPAPEPRALEAAAEVGAGLLFWRQLRRGRQVIAQFKEEAGSVLVQEVDWGHLDETTWEEGGEVVALVVAAHTDADQSRELLTRLGERDRDDPLRHRLTLAVWCLAEMKPECRERLGDLTARLASDLSETWVRLGVHGPIYSRREPRPSFPFPHLTAALRAMLRLAPALSWHALRPWVEESWTQGSRYGQEEATEMVALLVETGSPEVLDLVVEALSQSSGRWQSGIASALGEVRSAAVRRHLGELLGQLPWSAHTAASLDALRALRTAVPLSLVEGLGALVEQANAGIRRAALELGCERGLATPEFLTALARQLRPPEPAQDAGDLPQWFRPPSWQSQAFRLLAEHRPDLLPDPAPFLSSNEVGMPAAALEVGCRLGESKPVFLESAVRLLARDEQLRCRVTADSPQLAQQVGRLLRAYLRLWLDRFRDPRPEERTRRLREFVTWCKSPKDGEKASAAVQGVLVLLRDLTAGCWELLEQRVEALQRDPADDIREAATELLLRFRQIFAPQSVSDYICCFLTLEDPVIQRATLASMPGLSHQTAEVASCLVGLLRSRDPVVRRKSTRLLCSLHREPRRFRAALPALLADRHPEVRRAAVAALAVAPLENASGLPDGLIDRLQKGDPCVWRSVLELIEEPVSDAFLRRLESRFPDIPAEIRQGAIASELGLEATTVEELCLGLANELESSVPQTRRRAVWAFRILDLEGVSDALVERLASRLGSVREDVQTAVAQVIDVLGLRVVRPGLLARVADLLLEPDVTLRCTAVSVLRRLGAQAAVPAVMGAIEHLFSRGEFRYWSTAAEVLSALGPATLGDRLPQVLLPLLRNTHSDIPFLLRDLLHGTRRNPGGERDIQVLAEQLLTLADERNRIVRLRVVQALEAMGDGPAQDPLVVERLRVLLDDGDPDIRRAAFDAVLALRLPLTNPDFTWALEARLPAEDERWARLLHLLQERANPTAWSDFATLLDRLLHSPRAELRAEAALCLRELELSAVPDLPSLLPHLNADDCSGVRQVGVRLLRAYLQGAGAGQLLLNEEVFPSSLLYDPDLTVSDEVVVIVNQVEDPEVRQAIRERYERFLGGSDPEVCVEITRSLLSVKRRMVLPILRTRLAGLLRREDARVRRAAACLAVRHARGKARRPLLRLVSLRLHDWDREVRKQAVAAVRQLGAEVVTPRFLRRLARALRHRRSEIHKQAVKLVQALGRAVDQEEVVAGLVGLANRRPDFEIPVARALEGLGYRLTRQGSSCPDGSGSWTARSTHEGIGR
jgi:HEAT repeat protein